LDYSIPNLPAILRHTPKIHLAQECEHTLSDAPDPWDIGTHQKPKHFEFLDYIPFEFGEILELIILFVMGSLASFGAMVDS
jgi:hypothetical protein